MSIVTRGFHGGRDHSESLPHGQHLTRDFPVLSAGPTPRVDLDTWRLSLGGTGVQRSWAWAELMELPSGTPAVDSLDTLLEGVQTDARYTMVHSYGGSRVPMISR